MGNLQLQQTEKYRQTLDRPNNRTLYRCISSSAGHIEPNINSFNTNTGIDINEYQFNKMNSLV